MGAPGWGVASQGRFFVVNKSTFSGRGAPVWGGASQGCLCFFKQKTTLFSKQGAPVWGIASQGFCFFSKDYPFSFLDTTFQVNVAKSQCLRPKKKLSELITGIRGIHPIRGNGTNQAGPDLCSTRAWGKDDGS